MSELYIPNSISLRNFDTIFTRNDFIFQDKDVNISFHPSYVAMHPVGLAFYAALMDYWKENDIKRDATIDYSIKSIPYLQRMGFFSALNYKDPIETKTHEETGRFIPLTKVTNGTELESFIKSIDPILHTTRDNSRAIKHVFSELLRNVLEHADSRYGANVCATYNKKRKKISIGIADAGQGLVSSLRKSHRVKDSQEALIKALTPGITGSTKRIGGNEQNAGAGLFFTKCIAQSTRNHFLIYSTDAYYKLLITPAGTKILFSPDPLSDKSNIKSSLPNFKGTVVGIDIQIDNDKAFNNLIENIGKAYQIGVRKSLKDYYSKIKFT